MHYITVQYSTVQSVHYLARYSLSTEEKRKTVSGKVRASYDVRMKSSGFTMYRLLDMQSRLSSVCVCVGSLDVSVVNCLIEPRGLDGYIAIHTMEC